MRLPLCELWLRRTMLGAGGELEVPFARASSLRLGGLVLARPLFTELDWIESGGLLREHVPTQCSEAESGLLATLGILGAGVLADELLVFDYPSRRMAFARRGR